MKSFDTDLKKHADKIRLKASERRALRERVLSYMEYHPLPKQSDDLRALPTMLASEPYTLIHVTRRTLQFASGLFAFVLIVLPFAAERSVPGEALYLVKTGINEPIRAQFADSAYEEIAFETRLVERRIAEARALASEGKLTGDVQERLAETVKEHTKSVASKIAELQEEDADGAAIARIAFNSSLEVQSAVLNASAGEDASAPIGSILTAVNEARGEASVAVEGEPAPSYEGLLARIESETTRAYELFETIKQSATDQEIRSIERRLSDINRLILEAKEARARDTEVVPAVVATGEEAGVEIMAAMAAPEEDRTDTKLSSTLGQIQKLIVFMTDIDVREAVELETLVPVVLSGAERLTIVAEALPSLSERIASGDEAVVEIEDVALAEKATLGLAYAKELIARATAAVASGTVSEAEAALEELVALTSDIELLIEASHATDAEEGSADVEHETEGTAHDAGGSATSSPGTLEDTEDQGATVGTSTTPRVDTRTSLQQSVGL